MPETPSGDPFADLFGKLPDPRSRDVRRTGDDAGFGSRASGGGEKDGGQDPAPPATGAPLSRRELRAAAAGLNPATRPAGAPADETPAQRAVGAAPTAAAPRAAQQDAVLDESGLLAQPRTYTPRCAEPVDDDSWMLTDESEPALPYSRTGSTPIVPASSGTPADPTEAFGARATAASTRGASTATLEDLFSGHSSSDELGSVPPPRDKRKRRIGGWIALGAILLIIGGVAGGAWYVWTTYEDKVREVMGWELPKDFEEGLANGEAFVTVNEGDTGMPISQALFDAGVTMTPNAFYDYLIDTGENPPFVPGVFKLQLQMTSEAALAALLDPANKMENTAQLREGLTVEQSLPLLAEGTGLPVEDFVAATADASAYGVTPDPAIVAAGGQPLEGWLFPATYTFNPDVTAEQVIQTLVDRTVQSLDAAGVPEEDRQRVLTIASIIEREARYEADMQKVATVIENRLNPDNQETFGLLQMDSTAQYGFGEMHDGSASTSEEAQFDPNPWNTYVNAGLPVGPISNPGDAAISAVMNPSGGDWLYFVTVNLDTGETVFTTNLGDHNRAVAQWIAWCEDHPDSGC
jgi:UPF0755 protein